MAHPAPPIRDARINHRTKRVLCGWPGSPKVCPGVLGDVLEERRPIDGDLVPTVRLPEGFFFDDEGGTWRLSIGAAARLGRKSVPIDPLTGELHYRNQRRYRAGAPAHKHRFDLAPLGFIATTFDEIAAWFAYHLGGGSVETATGTHDATNIRGQAAPPFEVRCPQCGRLNRVRLDKGHGVG